MELKKLHRHMYSGNTLPTTNTRGSVFKPRSLTPDSSFTKTMQTRSMKTCAAGLEVVNKRGRKKKTLSPPPPPPPPPPPSLPDEIVLRIVETGIECSTLSRIDVCAFSLCCKNYNQVSNEDSVWSKLLAVDFPGCDKDISTCKSSVKGLYKSRYARYKQILGQLLEIRRSR